MWSYFREFLKMSDQIRGCGSSIRERTPRRSSPPRGDAAHMPVSQRNPPACGWDEGEEEQTWRIKSFQAWSSSCIPPCLSVFLRWCLTPSSPLSLSLSLSLSHFPPIHFHFLFLKPQWGCQTVSLMFPWCLVLRCCALSAWPDRAAGLRRPPLLISLFHTGANNDTYICPFFFFLSLCLHAGGSLVRTIMYSGCPLPPSSRLSVPPILVNTISQEPEQTKYWPKVTVTSWSDMFLSITQ